MLLATLRRHAALLKGLIVPAATIDQGYDERDTAERLS
jgi:hypothetical protein